MSPSPTPADARLLLEHAQWIRRLARSLVHDPQGAEDLSQETWTRLLERPPSLERPFRGWIATVMRNLVHAEHRGAARRSARERASARAEAEPSSHELLERATLQRELVQAVLELDEPYRTTLLLRYFEERSPAEIAVRERIPLATVKTRLARGIARLRERLGRTHGPDGRTSVLAALAALESPSAPPLLAWTALPLAMNAKLLVTLLALFAAGLAYLYFGHEPEPARRELASAPVEVAPADLVRSAPPEAPPAVEAAREVAPVDTTPARTSAAGAPVLAATVRGRVIDFREAPVGGVRVTLLASVSEAGVAPRADAVVAHTAADGSFEFAGPRAGQLVVSEPGWTTLLSGVPVDHRNGLECRIVVAPSVELAGVVVDETGVPLPAVRIEVAAPAALRSRLAEVLDFSSDMRWTTASDADGRFRFEAAPALPESLLRAELEGFRPHEEPAPLAARADLVLALARPVDLELLTGRVLDPAGSPVPDALVSHGLDTTRTDEDGRFRFQLDDPESVNRRVERFMKAPDDVLRALSPGFLPAELHARGRDPDGRPLWPTPLVLTLGGEPLAIRGRVLDERGEPRAGARVWVADATLFGALTEGAGRGPEFVTIEALLGGRAPGWSFDETGADGGFELAGLCERDYLVAAMDPATLQRVLAPEVAAGSRDLVLVLRTGELFPRLAGRVVDSHGAPVPGASVFPMCDAYQTKFEGQVISTEHETTAATRTDAEGRFVLARVPRDLVYLRIEASDVIPLEWGRGLAGGLARLAGERPEELVIAVERRCHFQIELEVAAEADQVGVLDAQGEEMEISAFHGNGRSEGARQALIEGRSAMLAVGDRAATLVLYRQGGEVRRTPIRLTPGEPTSLRL